MSDRSTASATSGWEAGFSPAADLQRLERTTVDGMGRSGHGRDLNTLDLSVPSARFRIDYQSPWPWLTGQIEVDLAGRPDLRDGYVQAKGENVAFRMGQFKMPVLAMQMESPWALPLVRRGLIHDLTVDWLDVAGRLPGAMLTFREKFGDIKPRLFLGAFQASGSSRSTRTARRDTDLVRERSLYGQNLVARGQVDVGSVEIGASYEHRARIAGFGLLRPLWTAGADVTVNHVFATGGLRLWADALAGASWYEHAVQTGRRRGRHVRRGAPAGGVSLRRRRAGGALRRTLSASAASSIPTSTSPRTWPGRRPSASTSVSAAARARPCRPRWMKGQRNFPPGLPGRRQPGSSRAHRAAGVGLLMFVVFEGIDGSGKTTVSNRVAARLREGGLKVRHLRADGKFASAVSEAIRDFGRDARNLDLVPEAEFLLYVARDVQLIEQVMRPALAEYDIVLVRSVPLHAGGAGADRTPPAATNSWRRSCAPPRGGLSPDLAVLVDVDPVLARARRKAFKLSVLDKRPPARKGLAGVGLQHRLRRGYLELAEASPELLGGGRQRGPARGHGGARRRR